MNGMLPPGASEKWGHLYGLKQRAREEWSAACPICGDAGHVGRDKPDRFRIFIDGKTRGWCRSCGHFEFLDSRRVLTPLERAAAQQEQTKLANQERERVRAKIERLEEAATWRGYHKAMIEQHRQLWRDAGVPDNLQDWWELGYNPELTYRWGDELKTSPALTIPYWHESHVVNIQNRLLAPPTPSDKYRFTQGLPAPVYLPDKDEMPKQQTLVVEGAKKAMVSWLALGTEYSVVGIPSKNITHRQVESLKDCEPIILALDPDANEDGTVIRNAKLLGEDRTRVASLPGKIDDLIVHYGAKPDDIGSFLQNARRV